MDREMSIDHRIDLKLKGFRGNPERCKSIQSAMHEKNEKPYY